MDHEAAYDDFQVDESREFPREVEARSGRKENVYLREFSEMDVRRRQKILTQSKVDRKRNQGGGDMQFHIERLREHDFENGIIRWDFTRLKRDEFGNPIIKKEPVYETDPETGEPLLENGEKIEKEPPEFEREPLPLTKQSLEKLPQLIADQIDDHIREVNGLPEDASEEFEAAGKKNKKKGEKHRDPIAQS